VSGAAWLARRDLAARRGRAALAAAVVAAMAASATALELVARAREDAVAARIDALGAPLTVVPAGATPGALARHDLGDDLLPADAAARVAAALGADLRATDARLVAVRAVGAAAAPVVGLAPEAAREAGLRPGEAALGSELGRRLGRPASLAVAGREVSVSGVRPSAGGADDVSVFLPLADAQAVTGLGGVNALRVYLRAGVSPADAEAALRAAGLGAAVVRTDRGEVADGTAQGALARHRGAAHLALALVLGVALLVAAHLDAAERRVELATLVAIGASRSTVAGTLLARSAAVAAAGALAGVAAGAGVAAAQDLAVAAGLVRAWPVLAATVGAAVALGVAAAAPTALACAARDPVRELQES
jgi:hypothetical protein